MSRLGRFVVSILLTSFLLGCISSQTTSRRPPDSNEEASDQNYQLGAQYYGKGSFELAKNRLERAVALNSKNANAYSLLALTYSQLDNDRLAMDSFDRAVRLEPDNFDVRNMYAIYLCGESRYKEAQEHFDRAIKVYDNDNREIMMTNAGVCMSNKPDYELAANYFQEAIDLKPRYGEALIQMAALKHRVDPKDISARGFLQRYLAFNEATAPALYLGIQIETSLGNDRDATDYTTQLLRDFPDSPESKLLLRNGS